MTYTVLGALCKRAANARVEEVWGGGGAEGEGREGRVIQ